MNESQQTTIDFFLGRKVHIYGVTGAEGYAVLEWLHGLGHTQIIAHDIADSEDAVRAEWVRVHEGLTEEDAKKFEKLVRADDIAWALGDAYAVAPNDHDIIFVAQSWFRYPINSFLKRFFNDDLSVRQENMALVWTVTRLYFALFPGTLLAVTGSDGKTTTTRMLGKIMSRFAKEQGVTCIESGNDRTHTQSLVAVQTATSKDFLVLEVSDRQLSFKFPLMPDVAVVTNVTPNKHMDDYGGFDSYVQTKANLIRFQTHAQCAILNADDAASTATLSHIGDARRLWVSVRHRVEDGAWCDGEKFCRVTISGESQIMKVQDLGVIGNHNWYNALQALLAAESIGVSLETAAAALKEFSGVPHRLQPVRIWHRLQFIEDSSGGNPANIPITIQAFKDKPLILIVGGYRPNVTTEEISGMIDALDAPNSVAALLLIGQVAPKLKELIEASTVSFRSIYVVNDLPGAFAWVREHGDKIAEHEPAVVCMTPGFESFDQYKDYRARADHFIQLVNELSD
ncbi:MAG: Mur ligase family protein [Candidatus Magasanikbacteria bacterium]|nr:Mur ligase family protein [Candidatus Magasanikbacteria bacterium]